MKVLVQTYDTAFQNAAGGVHNRIVGTIEALKRSGCDVELFDKFRPIANDIDILHVFMLDVSNLGLMRFAKSKGIKIVLSAVVGLNGGKNIDFYWKLRGLPIMTTYKLLFQMCELADAIIAETKKEADFIAKHYHVDRRKIQVIPNGVDKPYSTSNIIFEKIGKECDYVLEVARFDKNKNQMKVIEALMDTEINVIFAGGPDFSDRSYYDRCREIAHNARNIHFLGWVDYGSDLLNSAYSNAKVIVVPSHFETFGLSIVEGAIAGAIPVVSETLPILEYSVFRNCIKCNPNSADDIREKITLAMGASASQEFIEEVQDVFSWESVAEQHIGLYRSLL